MNIESLLKDKNFKKWITSGLLIIIVVMIIHQITAFFVFHEIYQKAQLQFNNQKQMIQASKAETDKDMKEIESGMNSTIKAVGDGQKHMQSQINQMADEYKGARKIQQALNNAPAEMQRKAQQNDKIMSKEIQRQDADFAKEEKRLFDHN